MWFASSTTKYWARQGFGLQIIKVKARSAAERIPGLTGGFAFQELGVQHEGAALKTS